MKETGIVRKADELGRFVLPIELRRTMGIGEKDGLEIVVDGERVIVRKHASASVFTGGAGNLRGRLYGQQGKSME